MRLAAAMMLAASSPAMVALAEAASPTHLEVPVVRQSRERCGPAAVEMVLRYYRAGSEAVAEAGRAYDPALRGSLITDLAASARRAGFDAVIVTLTPDSLVTLLAEGIPPIVLYQNGRTPLTVRHFGVVTGWNPGRATFTLNDGGSRPREAPRADFEKRWRTAGSQALVIRKRPS